MRRPRPSATAGVLSPELRSLAWLDSGEPFEDRYTDRVSRMLHRDHARDFLPQLLQFGDAISMGHALESRVPFLDHRVVELVFRLGTAEKFDGVETKLVLKRALGEALPQKIVRRTDKVGFATPLAGWLRASLDSQVRPLLLSHASRERGVFNTAAMEQTLGAFERGDDRLGGPLLRWLSVEIWFRTFLDARPAARPARVDERSVEAVGPGLAT
jgi:asparagine synthase (glutamine-hydrolysing)